MITILQGDVIQQLRTLPDESVHCCVTSPPYWGLRDYSTNGQIGLEKTPEEYVAKMVQVFREVRRVLRKDGTLWLNLGDSYSSGGRDSYDRSLVSRTSGVQNNSAGIRRSTPSWAKPKDLLGIPWRVAFALQADGWWLRSDIIWSKPNPMPESVRDRPTKAHEYLFLLTKSANYFYDAEAIREKHTDPLVIEGKFTGKGGIGPEYNNQGWNGKTNTHKHTDYNPAGRNKRSVWTVATAPYPEAHFATYPPDLIKPCILAGTSAKGCCAKCGSPWERIVESTPPPKCERTPPRPQLAGNDSAAAGIRSKHDNWNGPELAAWKRDNPDKHSWRPSCECYDEAKLAYGGLVSPYEIPCTVLDPFAGSGTTGAVALELGRKAVLIELNPKYVELIKHRCNVTPGLQLAI